MIGRIVGYLRDVFSNESLYSTPADVRARVLAADGWLVSGGRDGRVDDQNSAVRIWDVNEGRLVRTMKGHKAAVTALAFKPDLRMIVSGSSDRSLRLWDPVAVSRLAGDQSLRTFSGYTSAVTSLGCQPSGPMLINASATGELHGWDMDQGISLRKSGLKMSFLSIMAILLAFPTGMLVDKFHPLLLPCWRPSCSPSRSLWPTIAQSSRPAAC